MKSPTLDDEGFLQYRDILAAFTPFVGSRRG